MATESKSNRALRNRLIFCIVVVLWFLFDRVTKFLATDHSVNMLASLRIDGVVEFSLVHNHGAAWGSFSGMLGVLVIVTVILCLVIAAYAFFISKEASLLEIVGLALVFAGGIGNLVDRVVNGYVIDFIAPLLIDFPTFNIADIGITCGIVCVVIAFAIRFFTSRVDTDRREMP